MQHLTTERSYWRSKVEPLCQGAKLWWDIQINFIDKTVVCKIVAPNQATAVNDNPDLIVKIDIDRAHRPEEEIMADIKKAVAEKSV